MRLSWCDLHSLTLAAFLSTGMQFIWMTNLHSTPTKGILKLFCFNFISDKILRSFLFFHFPRDSSISPHVSVPYCTEGFKRGSLDMGILTQVETVILTLCQTASELITFYWPTNSQLCAGFIKSESSQTPGIRTSDIKSLIVIGKILRD